MRRRRRVAPTHTHTIIFCFFLLSLSLFSPFLEGPSSTTAYNILPSLFFRQIQDLLTRSALLLSTSPLSFQGESEYDILLSYIMDSAATTNKRNSSRNNKSNSLSAANSGQAHSSKMSSFSSPHHFSISDYNRSNVHLKVSNDAISQLPQVFDSLLSSLSTFCQSGQQLASLLEMILEDTPLVTVANTYHNTCEELSLKCTQQESLLRQQIIASCQKMGPLVSSLRSSVGQYSKSGTKYEASKSQYESLSSDSKSSQAKVEQLQLKFESARNEFNHSLAQLGKTTDELDSAKINVLGSCFLGLIQTHAKLLSTAAQALAPLAELEADTLINAHPVIPLNAALVQDLTLNWLSSAQMYSNLRECGGSLPSNVISDLTNWRRSNEKRRAEINTQIDSLFKSYISEISNGIVSQHTVSGGFHLNPRGIALALKGCVSELESTGAGVSPLPSSAHETSNLIKREIPHIVLTVKGKEIGAVSSSDSRDNFQDKLSAVKELVSGLVEQQIFSEEVDDDVLSEIIRRATMYVLALSCQSVISRSCKIAAQLLYGRSNLVMVRESPLPEEVPAVTITTKSAESGEPVILIESQTVWWLVEDNGALLSPLSRYPPTHTCIARIVAGYAMQVNVEEFIKNSYYLPFIPSLTLNRTQVNRDYLSLYQAQSSSSKHHKTLQHSPLTSSSSSLSSSSLSSSSLKHHRSHNSLRYASSESDGIQDDSTNATVTPSSGHGSDRSRTGSGLGGPGRLYRSNSNDSISTATSNVTLKANQFDGPDDIMNILVSKPRGGLTQNSLLAHTTGGSRPSHHRYSHRRKELGSEGRREEKEKNIIIDKSSRTSSESDSVHTSKFTPPSSEDFNAIYNILDQPDSTPPGGSGYFDDLGRDTEDSEREFLSGDIEDHLLQSQIISNDENVSDLRKGGGGSIGTLSSTTPLTGGSSGCDSGIHVGGVIKFRNTSHRSNLPHLPSDEGSWSGFESIYNRRLGPICQPGGRSGGLSSDSDSETTSGRNSRDANIGDSPDELPGGRSSSSASLHSSSRMSHVDSSDSSSLPDTHDYQTSFNHAPGSHRMGTHHKRQASLSSYPNGPPLSQDGNDSARPSSFSQEVMISQDIPLDRDPPYPGSSHFSNPFDHEMRVGMQGGGASHSQFLSDPYSGAPPSFINEHHQRRIDYRRPPPPGPGPYWDPGFTPPGHMMPPPPQMRPHPPPPPHDMYHHGNGYRATTPEISPAPSPHPTPPTTPPPPMIAMQPSPIRLPPNPRPHPFRGPPPPPPHSMQFAHPPRGPPIPPHHHRPPIGIGPMPHPHPPPPRGPMHPPPHHGRHMPPGPPHGRMPDWAEWHH